METPQAHQPQGQKKDLYILSLDNARLFWILAIAILILVFLFLLGYWLGHDTQTPAPESAPGTSASDRGSELGTLRDELEKSLPGGAPLAMRQGRPSDDAAPDPFDMPRQGRDVAEPRGMAESRRPADAETARPRERLLLPDSPDSRQEVSAARLKSAHEQKEFESLKSKRPAAAPAPAQPVRKQAPVAKPAPSQAVPAAPPRQQDRIAGSLHPQALGPREQPAQGSGSYAVQVASLSSQAAADELCHKLAARGFQASMHTALIDGRTWYRVRVGTYPGQAEARQVRDSINASGLSGNAYVVKQ